MKKIFTLLLLSSGSLLPAAHAQTVNYVTEIVTSYGGYWRSGNGSTGSAALNSVKPDNSHHLLSFSANGTRYSTGVNDPLLITKGLSFTAANFRALPVANIGTPTGNTKVGLGEKYDGVPDGPSNPPPSPNLVSYLTDGPNGLDLGTGIANIPQGNITFTIGGIQAAALNDGVPDILVTQIAAPPTVDKSDIYSFLDAQGKIVGNSVKVTYVDGFPIVGNWVADFYEASQNPMTLAVGFTNTPRPLRLWTAELSLFGITTANYDQIKKFQIALTGDSDLAFVAYNKQSVTVLPVELTSFGATRRPDGQVRLAWRTASEKNAEAFEVELSTDGRRFAPVGRVAAAGSKSTPSDYQFVHRPAAAGPLYYRLHQLDLDGQSAYSPVVAVVPAPAAPAGAAYPNPFGPTLRLPLPAGTVTGEVCLLAADGRLAYQHTLTAAELNRTACELPGLPALPPGIYLLQTTLNGRFSQQKLVRE